MKKITTLFSALVLTAFGWQANAQYCTTGGASNDADSNVETVNITGDASSAIAYTGCSGTIGVTGLDDQTALSIDVTAGNSYNADVQFGTCDGNYAGAGEVWIDWNQNDVFETSESIGTWSGTPPVALSTFNFTVPAGAFNGSTRMRVIQQEGGSAPLNPCASFTYGSATDFTVVVSGGVTITCPIPNALTATNITATSADLGWTENGTAIVWDIELGATGFTQGTGTMVTGTTTNPHNLTALTANTAYDFYIKADCGGSTSAWVGPFSFTTLCNAFAVPFSENFSSTSTTQNCWTVIDNNNDGKMWDMDYTYNPLVADEVAALYTDGNLGANDDYLVTPTLTLTGNEQLRFSYRVQSVGEPNDFEILLSTTGVGVGSFTNTLMALDTFSNITYEEIIINLSAYTGNVNIAFHVPNGGLDGWILFIDSVEVEAIPSCPAPIALAATNITATTVDLGWTENGGASTWNIEWDTTGFVQGSGTGTTVAGTTTNPYALAGLTAATAYDFYVQADCGADSSTWTGPFNFTTLCAVYTPTYTETFTTFLPTCWKEAGDGTPATGPSDPGTSLWGHTNYLNAGGAIDDAAKINLYNTTRSDWLISPSFDLSAGGWELQIEAGVTDYDNAAAAIMGSDDTVQVLISTDNGTTWAPIYTWDVNNQPDETGATYTMNLSAYTGTNNIFAIWATDGAIDDTEDYDFHIGSFAIDVSTSVSNIANNVNLTIYPNPTTGVFTLNVNTTDVNELDIKVMNMQGQVVFAKNSFDNIANVNEQIDLSENANGIYFVTVTTDKGVITHKVVVQ